VVEERKPGEENARVHTSMVIHAKAQKKNGYHAILSIVQVRFLVLQHRTNL
jgi:hypothetical protein